MCSSAFSDEEPIEEHAETVTQILVPVAITMAIVIFLIKILTSEGELIRYCITNSNYPLLC
jgi:cation transport ATPase